METATPSFTVTSPSPDDSPIECCPNDNEDLVDAFSFWMEGIAIIAIGIPGIIGNMLSSLVLMTSADMKASGFNYLLAALAVVDSLLIGSAILDHSIVRAFDTHFNWYGRAFPHFIYPGENVVLCLSIFVVVAIAYERYVAVCRPFDYRAAVCTQSAIRRAIKLIFPAIVVAVLVNVPKYFETVTVEIPLEDDGLGNQTDVHVAYNITSLRRNPLYIHYYVNCFSFVSTGLVPVVLLVFLNGSIYANILETGRIRELSRLSPAVRDRNARWMNIVPAVVVEEAEPRENIEMEQLRGDGEEPAANNNGRRMSSKDFRMAMIMVAIVLVFFFCHFPRIFLNIYEVVMTLKSKNCGNRICPPTWFLCMVPISHFFLVFNSSINIVIYCLVGEGFRNTLRNSIKRRCRLFGSERNDDGRRAAKSPGTDTTKYKLRISSKRRMSLRRYLANNHDGQLEVGMGSTVVLPVTSTLNVTENGGSSEDGGSLRENFIAGNLSPNIPKFEASPESIRRSLSLNESVLSFTGSRIEANVCQRSKASVENISV